MHGKWRIWVFTTLFDVYCHFLGKSVHSHSCRCFMSIWVKPSRWCAYSFNTFRLWGDLKYPNGNTKLHEPVTRLNDVSLTLPIDCRHGCNMPKIINYKMVWSDKTPIGTMETYVNIKDGTPVMFWPITWQESPITWQKEDGQGLHLKWKLLGFHSLQIISDQNYKCAPCYVLAIIFKGLCCVHVGFSHLCVHSCASCDRSEKGFRI